MGSGEWGTWWRFAVGGVRSAMGGKWEWGVGSGEWCVRDGVWDCERRWRVEVREEWR